MHDKLYRPDRTERPTIRACLIHPAAPAGKTYTLTEPSPDLGLVDYGLCDMCRWATENDRAFESYVRLIVNMRLQKLKENTMGEDWSNDFEFVELTLHQKQAVDTVRDAIKELANLLQKELPNDGKAGRYRALAKTKLEECNWAATKCISRTHEW